MSIIVNNLVSSEMHVCSGRSWVVYSALLTKNRKQPFCFSSLLCKNVLICFCFTVFVYLFVFSFFLLCLLLLPPFQSAHVIGYKACKVIASSQRFIGGFWDSFCCIPSTPAALRTWRSLLLCIQYMFLLFIHQIHELKTHRKNRME